MLESVHYGCSRLLCLSFVMQGANPQVCIFIVFFGLHLALCNYYNNIINMFNDMHTHTSDIHIVVKIFAFLSGCISVYVDCEN